jgi:Tfp pilus assembly protein PilO
MDKNKIWILGSAIVMIGILALGWFVGVDPQLKAKAFTDEQRVSVEAQNTATELAIVKLKGDFESIDALRDELAGLRGSIPADGQLPAFLTQLDTLASDSATKVTSLTVAEAIEYTAPETTVVAPPVEEAEEGETEGEAPPETDAAAAPEVPETPTVITDARITSENFVAIPITVTVQGDRNGARSFIDKLQHGPRLFMATQITIAPKDDEPGQFDTTVTGYIYALLAQ